MMSDTPAPAASRASNLLRELNLHDGIAIVAGTIIGSGIFLVPANVAHQLHSFSAVFLVWTVGGILSLSGAIALGELGAMFPGAGGLYVYLREAYGRPAGFLYGWGLLTLIHSGSIATLAVAFRIYLAEIFTLTPLEQKLSGIGIVLLLTGMNCFGLRAGKGIQNLFTAAKLGGLTLMIGLLLLRGHPQLLIDNLFPMSPVRLQPWHFGIALTAVLWAYEGWHVVSFSAGEFKLPQRDLPRSFFWGTLIVAATYLLANTSYYFVLKPAQIAQAEGVASVAVGTIFGATAAYLIAILILVSIVGSINGMILTGSRVYYAMAQEGLFFKSFSNVNPRTHAPVFAICVQGLWSACLTLLGTFQELFTYVVFTAWIFYGLAVAGVIVLRIRRPNEPRPFRTPGYPWLPILFVLAAIGTTTSAVLASPLHALIGVALILSGLPVYLLFPQRTSKPANPTS